MINFSLAEYASTISSRLFKYIAIKVVKAWLSALNLIIINTNVIKLSSNLITKLMLEL